MSSAASSSAPPEIVDIGANLTAPAFHADLPEVMARAARAGVSTMVVTGTSVAGSGQAAALARRHGALFATAGVHPHHANDVVSAGSTGAGRVGGAGGGGAGDGWIAELRALASEPRVLAIGECGLDFNRNYSGRAEQLRAFEAQLALAEEMALPVFLHERDAHVETLAILRAHRPRLARAVIHCFTGTAAELDAYLALDLHIGITGWICDERRGRHLVDVVGRIPADRLMIETDAPYILPRTMPHPPKDRRNEPAFLPHVLGAVAAARREDPAVTARATTATARAFFAIPTGASGNEATGTR